MEGWKKKEKEGEERKDPKNKVTVSSLQEEEEVMTREAEDSLGEKENKRKVEGSVPGGGKLKGRKMEKLEGLCIRTSPQEEEEIQGMKEKVTPQKWSWNYEDGCLLVDGSQKERQSMITQWTGKAP